MTFPHSGLYFGADRLTEAQANAAQPPLSDAWDALREREPVTPLDIAFRARFLDEPESAQRAMGGLLRAANAGLSDAEPVLRAAEYVSLLHAFELIRGIAELEPTEQAAWLDYAATEADALLDGPEPALHIRLWRNLARMTSAVVLERSAQAEDAAREFERVVTEEVRPQGYMTKVVSGEDGGSLFRQIEATAALVLTAEAGQLAGFPLWEVEVRGVSAMTAALLPHYYFYDTRKWKWDRGVPPEDVQARFHRFGGYLEIVHLRSPNKDLGIVLEDLRPLNTPLAGGWTTLSHGYVEKRQRRGLFGART